MLLVSVAIHTIHFVGKKLKEDCIYSGADPKVNQFYIRSKAIDKIPYGQESNERINVAHLEA